MSRRLRRVPRSEEGFALIEMVISALIIVLATGGAIQLLTSTGRAAATERNRAQAYALAQEDQARLRSMRITDLQGTLPAQTITLDGTPFRVVSSASFVRADTGSTSCSAEATADYVRVGSKVTWPSMSEAAAPVFIESVISPSSGSIDPSAGNLAITILNSEGNPLPSVGVTGAGTSSDAGFAGTTNSDGCVFFGDEPAQNYSVTPQLSSPYVNQSSQPPAPATVGVIPGSTTSLNLSYDLGGTIQTIFKVKSRTQAQLRTAQNDVVQVEQTEPLVQKAFGTVGANASSRETGLLYPLVGKTYSIYASPCPAEKLETVSPTLIGTAAVTRSSITKNVVVQMPALYLSVIFNGTGATKQEKEGVNGAEVVLTNPACKYKEKPIARAYETGEFENRSGTLTEPAVPIGTYNICVSAKVGSPASRRRWTMNGVTVGEEPTFTLPTINLATGTSTSERCQ